MNFQLSIEWLKEFVDVRVPPQALADLLSLHSVSVERVQRMGEGLDPTVVVGRIEKLEPHPNADKLRVAYVATHSSLVPRPSSLHRVVCGGTNLREGMLVAYAPAGARVRWHGQGELVELKPTGIRGVRSDGMICAASEIGLGDFFPAESEREILDLSFLESERSGDLQVATRGGLKPSATRSVIGRPLAVALGLDDTVLECEITTNRPDLMCVEELAREVAAVTNAKRKTQNTKVPKFSVQRSAFSVSVRVESAKDCPRYGAVVIDGITVGPSPWWMQRRLLAAGLRPINNVVDVTNYVMLELGQPLHAFDAAKLIPSAHPPTPPLPEGRGETKNNFSPSHREGEREGVAIVVRRAKAGESLQALDGITRALTPDVLVIANAERPIALAGIMGGKETGVTAATTRIVLECANFDPTVIRKGARHLNIRTDAATRFEKELQPEAINAVLPRAIELLCELTGGAVGKVVIVGKKSTPMRPIAFRPAHVSARIGITIPPASMRRTLTALGCRTSGSGATWRVTPPWWRRGDLEGPHDLVEEIARLYGYHKLPSVLPSGVLPASVLPPRPSVTMFGKEDHIRDVLAGAGATEVMTYSLTSRESIERCGYAIDAALALENSLSEEFAYLRPSVLPTILPIIAQNQEHHPKGLVFEMGNVFIPSAERRTQNAKVVDLPREEMRLCIAAYGRMVSGGHVTQLKGAVEHLFARLGIRDAEFRPSEQCVSGNQQSAIHHSSFIIHHSAQCLWHPGRTMDVIVGGVLVGVLGEVHPSVVDQFGIGQRVAVAELDLAPILAVAGTQVAPSPPPTLPSVKRDIAIVVDRRTPYADIAALLTAFDPLLDDVELFDQYEGAGVAMGKKSLAFHLTYQSPDRTLTATETDALQARLLQVLRDRFGAEIRE